MGSCCSKKPTEVVDPFVSKAEQGNDVLGYDNLASTSCVELQTKCREQTDLHDILTESLILGRHERTIKARQFLPYDAHTMLKPKATSGQPWTDEMFPREFEKDREGKAIKLTWKRPKDFTSEVNLFGNTTNRYCVKQGQVNDCFFISTLSAIADHPEYIKQIFPEDAYETDHSKYTGIVHCRFWWMGEWIDVYTDDFLPCYDDLNKFVGAHSDDKNIVWIPLAEKALARLYGSYKKIAGNQTEVFRLLTGGLVEEYKTYKTKKDDNFLPPDELYERVDKALKSGSSVLTNISENVAENELKGLISNHAYSVTGVLKTEHLKKVTKLLRIRNPWGEKEKTGKRVNDGEWKGRWSYTSTEWEEVDKALRKQHNVHIDKGGEFWICMEDFFKLFETLCVCDRVPNFDKDGFKKEDGLDKVINILGEWHGGTSAGNEEKNKMRNPRFILTIPEQNNAKAISSVIEITREFQDPANSKDEKDELLCVIDIYKIEKEEVRDNRVWMSLNKQTVEKQHIGCRTTTYLCKLSPGDYLLVPYYYVKPPISKSFCIRIFTSVNVRCRQLLEHPVAMTGKPSETFEDINGSLKNEARAINVFGEWKGETAAGSDPVNRLKNPRFILTIPENRKAKIAFQLRQQTDLDKTLHCRLDVFKIDADATRNNRRWMLLNQITNMETFMAGGEVSYNYELASGKYLLLPNYSERNFINRAFCIRILAFIDMECGQLLVYPVAMTGKPSETFEDINGSLKNEVRAINVFGEWKGETAAGSDPVNRLKNPRFILTIPANRKAKIVLQLMPQTDIDKTLHCRLDVFKIEADTMRNNRRWMLLNQITNMETFMTGGEVSYDYELSSGKYLLLPNYMEKDRINCAFCIRMLAFMDIQCEPQTETPVLFIRKTGKSFEYGNQSFKLEKIDFVCGEWVQNLTADGQISSNSFNINPQYELSITGNAPQPVLVDLLQETVEPFHAVGCHIIQIDEDQHLPVCSDVLRKNAQVKTLDGKTHPCMRYSEASGHYLLPPGRYLVLVYADKPTDEKKFALVIAAQAQSKIRLTEPK